jgi:hypothetical protein
LINNHGAARTDTSLAIRGVSRQQRGRRGKKPRKEDTALVKRSQEGKEREREL